MDIRGKRVLVIGGAGLIGSHIAKNRALPFSNQNFKAGNRVLHLLTHL